MLSNSNNNQFHPIYRIAESNSSILNCILERIIKYAPYYTSSSGQKYLIPVEPTNIPLQKN